MSAQQKREKALLDAKIAEVREVVRHASNTEIILALHNFDMDVNRTINAFTEGKDAALGDWETNGTGGKKKKNKKKPSTGTAPTAPVSKPTPAPAKPTTSEPPKPKVDAAKLNETVQTFKSLDDSARTEEVARLAKDLDQTVQKLQRTLIQAEEKKAAAIQAILTAVQQRDLQLNAELAAVRAEVDRQTQKQRSLLEKIQKSAQNGDIAKFTAGNASLEQILNSPYTFDENPPLRSIGKFGSVYQTGSVPVPPVQPTTKQPQANGQPKPAENKVEKKQNGVAKANGVEKISTSQSSLVSSEDSGLGQVSPGAQQEKVRTQAGGIVMEAEGISLDALADIQRVLAEQLKAQGIDESILSGLSGLGGTNVVAPRRRQPKKDAPKDKKNGSKVGAHS
ncbi:unnamed protein product [Bursaphelenchus xylophilus]|uniref:(pine wood nematode) hypothetical protein n=1 Tax=Bursaphelenchus xylophilus TaxID=6326 RepID=A0A1I7S1U9_BURXY|nr:unnamed protein product [Bursaphelenchus xylophilus]CAG9089971.1 unnamed protein product [Bursaphelenchus xylophilus]